MNYNSFPGWFGASGGRVKEKNYKGAYNNFQAGFFLEDFFEFVLFNHDTPDFFLIFDFAVGDHAPVPSLRTNKATFGQPGHRFFQCVFSVNHLMPPLLNVWYYNQFVKFVNFFFSGSPHFAQYVDPPMM